MAKYTLEHIKIGDQLHDLKVAADGEEITVVYGGRRVPLSQALADMAEPLSITEIDKIMED